MPRLYLLLALIVAVGCLFGLAYCKGGSEPRKELKAARAETQAVTESATVSRDTAEQVDRQGAAVRERASRANEAINEAITAGDLGAADLVVMREADEAYRAALCAHRRVQREGDGTDPACAAEGH